MRQDPSVRLMVGSVLVVVAFMSVSVAFLASGPLGLASAGEPLRVCDRLDYFDSDADVEQFLASRPTDAYPAGGGTFLLGGSGLTPATAGFGTTAGTPGVVDFSTTNVQVDGIDEADVVKTDGRNAYAVEGSDVVIARVYPPEEARLLARIALGGTYSARPHGLFVDGPRLVVISSDYEEQRTVTRLRVYDVSAPEDPRPVSESFVSGEFVGARLVHGYAYVIASDYVYAYEGALRLPVVGAGGVSVGLPATQIAYFRDSPGGSGVTTVLAAEVAGSATAVTAFMAGSASTLYVSPHAIYLTGTVWRNDGSRIERTAIHRLAYDGTSVTYACTAEVPGWLLNQFSLDEYDGFLRVATTIGHVSRGWNQAPSTNNVYVLDGAMNPVGRLEGLAPGEQVYSARFLGDRAYVVTFKKVDPLFVIDLADPSRPRVLGALKIPGFSDYLHPIAPGLLLGIGKDAADQGDFAWYQGVKVSLFDVSDPLHPREAANVILGDRGTSSDVLYDHRAFLWHAGRNLLILPVDLAEIDPSEYGGDPPDWAYGTIVWSGWYVYRVTAADGFVLQGRIAHPGAGGDPYGSWYDGGRRSFWIEDDLYTRSSGYLQANRLSDLGTVAGLDLTANP